MHPAGRVRRGGGLEDGSGQLSSFSSCILEDNDRLKRS